MKSKFFPTAMPRVKVPAAPTNQVCGTSLSVSRTCGKDGSRKPLQQALGRPHLIFFLIPLTLCRCAGARTAVHRGRRKPRGYKGRQGWEGVDVETSGTGAAAPTAIQLGNGRKLRRSGRPRRLTAAGQLASYGARRANDRSGSGPGGRDTEERASQEMPRSGALSDGKSLLGAHSCTDARLPIRPDPAGLGNLAGTPMPLCRADELFPSVNYLTLRDRLLNDAGQLGRMGCPSGKCRFTKRRPWSRREHDPCPTLGPPYRRSG